jgi:hypothetical protein
MVPRRLRRRVSRSLSGLKSLILSSAESQASLYASRLRGYRSSAFRAAVIVAHSRPVAPFRFQFRKFRIWQAAFIGIFLAVERPDMRRRNVETQRFGSFDVYNRLKFGRRLHR